MYIRFNDLELKLKWVLLFLSENRLNSNGSELNEVPSISQE